MEGEEALVVVGVGELVEEEEEGWVVVEGMVEDLEQEEVLVEVLEVVAAEEEVVEKVGEDWVVVRDMVEVLELEAV